MPEILRDFTVMKLGQTSPDTESNTQSTTPTKAQTHTSPLRNARSRLALVAVAALSAIGTANHFRNNIAIAADTRGTEAFAVAPAEIETEQALIHGAIDQPRDQFAMDTSSRSRGRIYPVPELDVVSVTSSSSGALRLSKRPSFNARIGDRFASVTPNNNYVFYTLDPELQDFVSSVVKNAAANHVAVVAMNPRTGAILAIAGKSPTVPDIEYHAGFPAASLFKVVTAAAAVEQAGIDTNSLIAFRGGTYTLNEWNYRPNPRADRRMMSVGEAMGRSCNPVFGHIGLKYLNGSVLSRYANKFGFNQSLDFPAPLPPSSASIPHEDPFELSRTSAGFGQVKISPVHAAALVAGIANDGLLPRPQLIERIADADGRTIEQPRTEILQRIVEPGTAQSLLEMMRNTTTIGTSRREFMRGSRPTLGNIEVAAKTGTLSGSDPVGLNNWFIAAAPIANPELAVAVITVDARHGAKASHLGRLVFQKFFRVDPPPMQVVTSAPTRKKHYRSTKASHYHTAALKSSKASKTKRSKKGAKRS
jgi:membrane peptidoglycan carboxypeptidase